MERAVAFWDAMAALSRRWYVVVPLLLIASLATVGTMKIVKPTYEAQAQLLMLNPPTASDSKLKINPYLSFSDALGITGDAVSRVVQSDAYVRSIAAQGGTATFQLAMRADALAPVMNVVASD